MAHGPSIVAQMLRLFRDVNLTSSSESITGSFMPGGYTPGLICDHALWTAGGGSLAIGRIR